MGLVKGLTPSHYCPMLCKVHPVLVKLVILILGRSGSSSKCDVSSMAEHVWEHKHHPLLYLEVTYTYAFALFMF